MSLHTAAQLHPPSALVDSLSKFQPHCLSLLRHSHSKPFLPHSSPTASPPPPRPPPPPPSPSPSWILQWKQPPFRILPRRPKAVVDYRGTGVSDDEEDFGTSRSSGSSTMEKIVEKLKKFGYVDEDDVAAEKETVTSLPEKGSVEDIFYAEDGILPNARGGLEEIRFPWEKPLADDGGVERSEKRKKTHSSLAELTLPEGELRRLRHLAIRTKSKTKVGGAGVTKEVVDKIHEKWKTEEVVRLKCEGPPALNMKRMHEILERKTGGLVIWRSGTSISLYRGVTYEIPQSGNNNQSIHVPRRDSLSNVHVDPDGYSLRNGVTDKAEALVEDNISDKNSKDTDSFKEIKYEHEVEKLLSNLGPRFIDWPGSDPLPVDADLLPGVVPDYNPPFRILPYGVRRSLGVKDQTILRRLARVLPPHFAVGRSRQLQGLATAMVKLWENTSIAKIALKRGVQLTTSERMAEDLKKLTGGTLLCRNKDYIVFYRGKDFLSPEMTDALLERERLAKALQDEEEQARLRASFSLPSNIETEGESATAGTLGETLEADTRWGKQLDDNDKNAMLRAAEVAKHASLVKKLERKLSIAESRLFKAEKALGKVEEFLKPAEHKIDTESITDEERFMFRKLGLKMKAFLLLGRRGVFGGTVENMHLHWKYRELVKIIVKAKTFGQVKNVALSLEAESGGILVSVDKISKGFAIIVYRGKDYKRPPTLRPKNLLTKRKALARSIELQRREALSHHITNLNKQVETLKAELDQMEAAKEHGDENLYAKLDTMYLSADEETEDEGDDAYLETSDGSIYSSSDDKDDDEAGNYIEDVGHDNIDNEAHDDNLNEAVQGEISSGFKYARFQQWN